MYVYMYVFWIFRNSKLKQYVILEIYNPEFPEIWSSVISRIPNFWNFAMELCYHNEVSIFHYCNKIP